MRHHGLRQGSHPDRDADQIGPRQVPLGELPVQLGQQGPVALHDPPWHALVARPRGVLHEQSAPAFASPGGASHLLAIPGVSGGLLHGFVVRISRHDHRGPLGHDRGPGPLRHDMRYEDARLQPEQPGHPGDGPPVVPVGRGHQLNGVRCRGPPEPVQRDPDTRRETAVPDSAAVLAEEPGYRPGRAQDLERAQAHPGGLVLDEHPPDAQFVRERGQLGQLGGPVAGEFRVKRRRCRLRYRGPPLAGGRTAEPGRCGDHGHPIRIVLNDHVVQRNLLRDNH